MHVLEWRCMNFTESSKVRINSIPILAPTRQQAIRIGILSFSFKKMHLKLLSAKMAAILSMERWVLRPAWWRHQMETFSALLAICAGNSPIAGEFPAQRPVTRSFDVFFDLRLNKRLSKQCWCWWFETPSRPLWRHCNGHSLSLLAAVVIQWNGNVISTMWNFHRWLHRKLSFWHLVQLVMKICSKWRHFYFSVTWGVEFEAPGLTSTWWLLLY